MNGISKSYRYLMIHSKKTVQRYEEKMIYARGLVKKVKFWSENTQKPRIKLRAEDNKDT